jgi:hypothetical protein
MVIATADLIYIVGFIVVASSLFIPWRSLLLFCGLASIHLVFGVLSMCGVLPDLPTLTNNNYLVLIHGDVDIYWFVMSVVIYFLVVVKSTWWELE